MVQQQETPIEARTRQRHYQEKAVEYLGEMLLPSTEGFDHVNLDMSFSYLGNWEIFKVLNLSMSINICHMYGWKQSEYLLRGELASLLNSARSRNGKSMDMFTTVTTKQSQEFRDDTPKAQSGFSFFNFQKKGHQAPPQQ